VADRRDTAQRFARGDRCGLAKSPTGATLRPWKKTQCEIPDRGDTAPMEEDSVLAPTAVCLSDDDLFYALTSPESVQLADVIVRIAQRLNAHERDERDMLDPRQ
jgi:hypothetical protein